MKIEKIKFLYKDDFTLDGMEAECRGDIAFILLLHMRKRFAD